MANGSAPRFPSLRDLVMYYGQARGWSTQRHIAVACGIDETALSRLLNGEQDIGAYRTHLLFESVGVPVERYREAYRLLGVVQAEARNRRDARVRPAAPPPAAFYAQARQMRSVAAESATPDESTAPAEPAVAARLPSSAAWLPVPEPHPGPARRITRSLGRLFGGRDRAKDPVNIPPSPPIPPRETGGVHGFGLRNTWALASERGMWPTDIAGVATDRVIGLFEESQFSNDEIRAFFAAVQPFVPLPACPECRSSLMAGNDRCPKCGQAVCPRCSAAWPAGAGRCTECDAPALALLNE